MKLVDHTVSSFLEEVDSSSPAPGGGSVSALSGAIGASLARMVGHLTITKKAFKALDESIQNDFLEAFEDLHTIARELERLVDKDTDAFNEIMAAFKLPKDTDDEKKVRSEAIQVATLHAIKVPFEVAQLSYRALTLLPIILEYGNKNCISDLGVAVQQLSTAVQGAIMNVKINLGGLKDDKEKEYYHIQTITLLRDTLSLSNKLTLEVEHKL